MKKSASYFELTRDSFSLAASLFSFSSGNLSDNLFDLYSAILFHILSNILYGILFWHPVFHIFRSRRSPLHPELAIWLESRRPSKQLLRFWRSGPALHITLRSPYVDRVPVPPMAFWARDMALNKWNPSSQKQQEKDTSSKAEKANRGR